MTNEQLEIIRAELERAHGGSRNIWHPDYKPEPAYGITADNLDAHITYTPQVAMRPVLGDDVCRAMGFTLDGGE